VRGWIENLGNGRAPEDLLGGTNSGGGCGGVSPEDEEEEVGVKRGFLRAAGTELRMPDTISATRCCVFRYSGYRSGSSGDGDDGDDGCGGGGGVEQSSKILGLVGGSSDTTYCPAGLVTIVTFGSDGNSRRQLSRICSRKKSVELMAAKL
jgi:hypothetical protein